MIRLNPPELKGKSNGEVRLSCRIQSNAGEQLIWYDFPEEYGRYLMLEKLDAFLVAILFMALKKGEDIELKAPVSRKLYYNLTHYLIDALCLSNPDFKPIKINYSRLDDKDYNTGGIAATGMSCGVDSFATFFDHINEESNFRLGYLTFLNVGSHGDMGGPLSREVFQKRFGRALAFSKRTGVPLIKIDSNISEVLRMNFLQTNTLRNISAILHLEKLFKNYYLASKNRFDSFYLNPKDNQDFDTLTLSLLSTESIDLHSAVSNMKRSERTQLISNFKETYDLLDVCVNPVGKNKKINCSECFKCMRTLLTLDLYGKIYLYREVFDLERYYRKKEMFIAEIIANRNKSYFNEDLYKLLKQKSKISLNHRLKSKQYKIEKSIITIKKNLKKSLN